MKFFKFLKIFTKPEVEVYYCTLPIEFHEYVLKLMKLRDELTRYSDLQMLSFSLSVIALCCLVAFLHELHIISIPIGNAIAIGGLATIGLTLIYVFDKLSNKVVNELQRIETMILNRLNIVKNVKVRTFISELLSELDRYIKKNEVSKKVKQLFNLLNIYDFDTYIYKLKERKIYLISIT